jgi:hypothetical protein
MNQWSSQQTSNYDRDKFGICDRCGLYHNVFYRWQKVFFENGAAASLTRPAMTPNSPKPEKLVKLEGKHRNEKNLDNNEKFGKNTSGW